MLDFFKMIVYNNNCQGELITRRKEVKKMKEIKEIKVKEWFVNKAQNEATRYNIFFDHERNEDGTIKVENGFVTVFGEIVAETEKAIKVELMTGSVVGSGKGWQTWIPKSVCA